MQITWDGTCLFCACPLDISIEARDSYEHFLYKKYAVRYGIYLADNTGYVRVVGGKCRWVCRSCFSLNIRIHASPRIMNQIQIGKMKMHRPISTAVSFVELETFCDFLKRNFERERDGRAIP